jgi:hypothetical protein
MPRPRSSPRARIVERTIFALIVAAPAIALAQPQTWCVPGTSLCTTVQGQASGNVQGQGQGQGQVPRAAPTPVPTQPPQQAPTRTPLPQPTAPPPVYVPPAPAGPTYRAANGFSTCAAVRVGFWSGLHYGGCAALSVRGEDVGFDLELDVLGGGTVPTLDFLLPISIVVPLGNTDDLFTGPYLRFGPDFGYSATLDVASDGFFRLGGHFGGGYGIDLADGVALRLLDVRFYADGRGDKTPVDSDRVGDKIDLGLLFTSGVIFK